MIIKASRLFLKLATIKEIEGNPSFKDQSYAPDWPPIEFRLGGPYVAEQLKIDALKDNPWWMWFLFKNNKELIGYVGFKGFPDNGEIELTYCVCKSHREKGYAFEASQALIQWAKQKDEVKKIVANCNKKNIISKNLLIKLGFTKIATVKNNLFFEMKVK